VAEERDDVVVLVDENGEETEFEHLDSFELNGNEYVVLIPLFGEEFEEAEEDEEGVVILRVENDADGEDSFVSIDNEEELEAAFEEFKLRMEDEYDFYEDE
jgi:uncharacterized protein YrzB (UPF0473 family)